MIALTFHLRVSNRAFIQKLVTAAIAQMQLMQSMGTMPTQQQAAHQWAQQAGAGPYPQATGSPTHYAYPYPYQHKEGEQAPMYVYPPPYYHHQHAYGPPQQASKGPFYTGTGMGSPANDSGRVKVDNI